MLKLVKKYQWGSGQQGLGPYDPQGNLAQNSINSITNSWLTNLNKRSNTPAKPQSYFSSMGKNIPNAPTNINPPPSFKGLGSGLNLTGNKATATGSGVANKSGALGMISDIGGTVAGLGKGIAMAFGAKEATIKSGASEVMNGVADAVGSLGPIGSIVGTGLKVLSVVNDLAGSKLKDQGTKDINTGAYTTQINSNAGGKLDVFNSLFTRKKRDINNLTKRMDNQNLRAADVTYGNAQNQLAATNSYGDIATRAQQQLAGGIKTNILSSKKGGKVNPAKLGDIVNKAKRKVKKAQEGTPTDDLQKMENGGQVNVIPEGALHARKNNYNGELGEQVTAKGIPVISIEEGGKITQHAEIEHSEIIFNKQVSTQLENWFKKYKELEDSSEKSSLEIECGKFLTNEILNNTEDNTNLLEQV